jgi:glutathionylspermidine synthase
VKRIQTTPRVDWQKTVESQGMVYHTADGVPYWDESAYYQFSAKEVDVLEAASNELHEMCLKAVQHVIDEKKYGQLHIPEIAIPLIEHSWENETPALYGRFDFAYNGDGPPKMLEYNADTPTSLLEASVIQWYWQQDKFKDADQFNSIHEKLIAKWTELTEYLKSSTVHLAYMDTYEDYMTVSYLQDTAMQAGLNAKTLPIENVGWDSKDNMFVDEEMYSMRNIFKLYPWEWLLKDEFGENVASTLETTFWMEPAWKMILSNKGILPILWELNPNHPNLLASYYTSEKLPWHVKKPFYSREGANITINSQVEEIASTEGTYGQEGYIYQDLALLPKLDGNHPVIGSWIIDGVSAGIGIRESTSLITNNLSRFVPHIMG